MTKLSAWKIICYVFVLCAATAIALPAQTFNSLVSFDGADGANPVYVSLVQGIDGNLYGTTEGGGANNDGTVFKITPAGILTTLYGFCQDANCADGSFPVAGLLLATDGNLYGMTSFGGANNCIDGCGTIFRVTPGGVLTTLHSFCAQANCADGYQPYGAMLQAADGNFYGTTYKGGVGPDCYVTIGCGTVFQLTPRGTLATLYQFCSEANCADGGSPVAGLLQGTDGNLYGTTQGGGIISPCYLGCGTVFRITLSGRLTTMYDFCTRSGCSDGSGPEDALVQASDGNVYGTTVYGGGSGCNNGQGLGCGTAFRITPGGTLTTVHRFYRPGGYNPVAGVVQATDGNLYGTTLGGGDNVCGCGTIFEIGSDGGLTTLHSFDSTDGAGLYQGLLQATNGIFYGTTYGGGTGPGAGTVFSLSTGLGPFVTFVRAAGKVGQTGPILGQGFTGTTSVELNGIPANFRVVSDTYIRATVPAGATTGYVTVTTPSGTLTSNVPFHVLP